MKAWIDILSPKQLWMFTRLAEELERRGWEVLLTSRRYEQLDELIETVFQGWDILRVGEWGGGTLEGKLEASAKRLLELTRIIPEHRPDIAFSSGSPEASRIIYGLGKPHILVSDTPHSPVNPLSAPLSARVMTPWVISREEWVRAGAMRAAVRHYRALDPWFWLRGLREDDSALRELGLSRGRYVLVRLPETQAAYLNVSDEEFLTWLRGALGDMEAVVLPRYRRQAELAERILPNALVVRRLLPGPSILRHAAVFVGGGGTMTQEAALMGVPNLSVYPGRLPTVLRYLVGRGLVLRVRSVRGLVKALGEILGNLDSWAERWRRRSARLRSIMEEPERRVAEAAEKLLG